MKKQFLLMMVACLAVITGAKAAPVSKAEALNKAKVFMKEKGFAFDNVAVAGGPRKVAALSREESAYYYVFNNGENGGFVVISGDDRTQPVLAYSDTGHFDVEMKNESVKAIFDGYIREMDFLDEMGCELVEETTDMAKTMKPTTDAVTPLLTSAWGQNEPYNCKCPTVGGATSKIGCVGVVLAQMLYYYRDRMPAKLPNAISGYSSYTGIKAGVAFNWDKMFDRYDKTQTSAQLEAVGNLCYWSALSLTSTFKSGSNVTTASFSNIRKSLVEIFGFKSKYTQKKTRSSYTYQQWKNLILTDLYNGVPVPYDARASATIGHCMIIDGYDGNDLFHVNWGWDGDSNGYYLLSVMNKDYDGFMGYDAYVNTESHIGGQSALFDLQPINGYVSTDVNTVVTAVINSASSSTAKVTFYNYTSQSTDVNCGLGYYDANGNLQLLKDWGLGTSTLQANKNTGALTFTLAASDFTAKKLAKGTYKLYPIFKYKDDTHWNLCEQSTSLYYVKAVYSSSVSLAVTMESSDLSATISFPGSQCVEAQPVIVSVTNNGEDYNGYIYLFASTTTTKGSYLSYKNLCIPKGQTVKINLSFTPSKKGTYNVWATTNSGGSGVIGQSKVTISAGTSTRNLSVAKMSVNNVISGTKVLGTDLSGVASIKNNAATNYAGELGVFLYYKVSSSWKTTGNFTIQYIELKAGETLNVKFNYENLNPSSTYAVIFKYGSSGYLGNYLQKNYVVSNAVKTYDATGTMTALSATSPLTIPATAVAVDFKDAIVSEIKANANPNTLYFLNTGVKASSVKGLTGKNVVIGTTAETINLTDGYDFYTPKDITAKAITYTRTPSIGTSGANGWQTMVMPFAATKLTCDGKEIDWFHSASDYGKYLWIKDFSAIEGNSTVCFGYAENIKAYHPYIIAVPGTHWGKEYSLVGKKLVFSGSNATLLSNPNAMTGSDVLNFRGVFTTTKLSGIYVPNSTGSAFVGGTFTVKPFNCYFVATSSDPTIMNTLNIDSFDETDGIMMPFAVEEEMVDVFSLDGVKVGRTEVRDGKIDLNSLPKGVYIIKGKKFVK